MSLTGSRFAKATGVNQLVREAQRRVESLPGVTALASTCCLPLEGGFGLPLTIEIFPDVAADQLVIIGEGAGIIRKQKFR